MQIQRVPAAENYKKYLLSLGSKVIRIRSLSLKAVLLAKVHLCFLKRCMLVWQNVLSLDTIASSVLSRGVHRYVIVTFRFIALGSNFHYLPNCFVDLQCEKLSNVALKSSPVTYLWLQEAQVKTHAVNVTFLLFLFPQFMKRQDVVSSAKSVDFLQYVHYFFHSKSSFKCFWTCLSVTFTKLH